MELLFDFESNLQSMKNGTSYSFDRNMEANNVTPVMILLLIEIFLGVGVVVRVIIRKLGCYEVFRAFLYGIGALIGFYFGKSYLLNIYLNDKYHQIVGMEIYLPFIVFTQAYLIDVQLFVRNFGQICLASATFWLLSLSLGATIMLSVTRGHFSFNYLRLACIFCFLFPLEMTTELNKREIFINIYTFLEGETVVRIFLTDIVDDFLSLGGKITWYRIVIRFFVSLILSFILGFVLGKIHATIFIFLSYNKSSMVSYFMFTMFCSVLISRLLNLNMIVFLTTIGILMGTNRKYFSLKIDTAVIFSINYIFFFLETTISISAAILLFNIGRKFITMFSVSLGFLCFFTFVIVRLSILSLFRSILIKFTFGFSWLGFLILTFSGLKGNCTLIFLHQMFGVPEDNMIFWTVYIIIFVADFSMVIIASISMRAVLTQFNSPDSITPQRINLNSCIHKMMQERKYFFNYFKLDRLSGGANYELAMKTTEIPIPTSKKLDRNVDSEAADKYFNFGNQLTICPKCETEELTAPTKTELMEMTKCAENDIIKVKRTFYESQYIKGMLAKENVKHLHQIFQNSPNEGIMMDVTFDPSLQNKGFYNWLRKKIDAARIDETLTVNASEQRFALLLYRIILNRHSRGIKAIISVIYAIMSLVLLNFYGISFKKPPTYVTVFIPILCFYFIAEFLLKIILYIIVYGSVKVGFQRYFEVTWNRLDIWFLLLANINLVLYIMSTHRETNVALNILHFVLGILNLFRLMLVVRWISSNENLVELFICFCNINCNINLFRLYDLALCYMSCENLILMLLSTMIDNIDATEPIRKKVEKDRLQLVQQLIQMEFQNPMVVRLLKTEIVARLARKFLHDCMRTLQMNGQIDSDISKIIMLESSLRFNMEIWMHWDAYKIGPTNILQAIPWLEFESEKVVAYLQYNLQKRTFKENDLILKEHMFSDGIFIILSGIVRLEVTTSPEIKPGLLPIVDYLQTPKLDVGYQDYFIAGNSIGELCLLTARPYNCKLIAETPLKCYFISKIVMENAFLQSNDIICGLEARMWRSVTYNLGVFLLLQTKFYQNWSLEAIYNILNNAFVPTFIKFHKLFVTSVIRDVILLQGVVEEEDTTNIFQGPCYIPRTVRGIVKHRSSKINTESDIYHTKLMIIPNIDIDNVRFVEIEPQSFELISCYKETCLQHIVQSYRRNSMTAPSILLTENYRNEEEQEWSSDEYENARLQMELNDLVLQTDKKLEPMSSILPQMKHFLSETKSSSVDSGTLDDTQDEARKVKFRRRKKKKN